MWPFSKKTAPTVEEMPYELIGPTRASSSAAPRQRERRSAGSATR